MSLSVIMRLIRRANVSIDRNARPVEVVIGTSMSRCSSIETSASTTSSESIVLGIAESSSMCKWVKTSERHDSKDDRTTGFSGMVTTGVDNRVHLNATCMCLRRQAEFVDDSAKFPPSIRGFAHCPRPSNLYHSKLWRNPLRHAYRHTPLPLSHTNSSPDRSGTCAHTVGQRTRCATTRPHGFGPNASTSGSTAAQTAGAISPIPRLSS